MKDAKDMAPQHVDRPTEWGVLFALTLPENRTIKGRVRLNKTLALLQRDGFPIRNRFFNDKMGPFDPLIHEDAIELEHERLVSHEEIPIRNKEPLDIYRLDDKGLRFFQQKYSCLIDNLPYKRLFNAGLDLVRRSFVFSTSELVDRVHEELLTQKPPEVLREKMDSVMNSLGTVASSVEENRLDSCPVCLEVLGCSDFAVKSLKLAIEKGLATRDTGKNMVYYNAQHILHWASKLVRHDHVTDVRLGADELSRFRESICYRLYCLEENAELYGIARPIRDESSLKDYLQEHLGGLV